MSIGFFVPYFPKLSETFILREYLMLRELGLRLVPTAYRPAIETNQQPMAETVLEECFYLDHQLPGAKEFSWQCARFPGSSLDGISETVQSSIVALARYWQGCGVRHAHIHFGNEAAEIPLAAARLLGITCSLSLHAQDIYITPDEELERRLRQAVFAVTCTSFNRDELLRRCPDISPDRVRLQYHGVEVATRDEGRGVRDEKTFLAVARMVENKGFDVLLRAMVYLPEAKAILIGDGPLRMAWEQLAVELGITERVTFTGARNLDVIEGYYRTVTAVVVPCRVLPDGDSDGIPNVLLEAMAAGVPVVTTDIRSLAEVMHDGDNGLVVVPNDARQLADAMRRLLHEPELRQRLIAGGRNTVERMFDLRRNMTELASWLTGENR